MSRYRFSEKALLRLDVNGVEAVVPDVGGHVRAGTWLLELMGELSSTGYFTADDFSRCLSKMRPVRDSGAVFLQLIRAGIITAEKRPHDQSPPQLPWEEFGWGVARFFHDGVVHTNFIQGDPEGQQEHERASRAIAEFGVGPPVVKSYPGTRIALEEPTPQHDPGFFETLLKRRTTRAFSNQDQVDKQTLSKILHFAARAQDTMESEFFGLQLKRTSPSGGARHPVEIYPQIIRSNDLPTGSYYYDPLRHELVRIGDVMPETLYAVGQQQSGCLNVPVAFIVTARFSRNLWKYRYPKSYAFTILDVGHFVQTLILTCTAMGFNSFLTPALNVGMAQSHLGLPNHYDECPFYLITAGLRPSP